MTAVSTTPTEMLDPPLVPVVPASGGAPAGDFDLLISLWEAAFAGTPGAGAPLAMQGAASASATPDDPGATGPVVVPAPRPPVLPAVPDVVVVQEALVQEALVEPAEDEKPRDPEDRVLAVEVAPLIVLAAAPVPTRPAPLPAREAGHAPERAEPTSSAHVALASPVERGARPRSGVVLDRHPGPDVQPGLSPVEDGGAIVPTPRLAPESTPDAIVKDAPRVPALAGPPVHLAATPATEGDRSVPRVAVTALPPNAAPVVHAPTPAAERPSPTLMPTVEEPHPSLVARPAGRPAVVARDHAVEEASALEATLAPSDGPLRRVATVAGSRDDAGAAFSRAPREHDGSAASATPDAVTTGPVGAVSAPPDRPIAAAAHDRPRPEAPREVVEQITTRLRDVSGPGRHELTVRLDPPELGAVQIDARLDGSRLHLVIRAEQAVTSDLLTDALPRLRDALAHQGFTAGEVSVHLGFDASGRHLARDNAPAFRPSPDGELPRLPRAVAATARAVAVADGLDVWA
jgi:hypothetical protein